MPSTTLNIERKVEHEQQDGKRIGTEEPGETVPVLSKKQLEDWGLVDREFSGVRQVWSVNPIEGDEFTYRIAWEE